MSPVPLSVLDLAPIAEGSSVAQALRNTVDLAREAEERTRTQVVGSPATVADRLQALRDVVDADELLVTTITHRHADRVASYALPAREWSRRSATVAS